MKPRAGLTPEKILDCAELLANQVGPMGYSMSDVASALSVRSPTLYHYFSSLDAVRIALARRSHAELSTVLGESIMGKSGHDAAYALANELRRFAHARTGLYLAAQTPPHVEDEAWFAEGMAVLETFHKALASFNLANEEERHAVRMLRSAVHGFVVLELENQFGPTQLLDESFKFLVRAVVVAIGKMSKC
jgi:AcrR family transcriptional regulator